MPLFFSRNGGSKLFLPVWVGKNFDKWSTFGGGGCAINGEYGGKNYCLAGWAVTYQVTQSLNLGTEIYRQGAESADAYSATGLGVGFQYTAAKNIQLLASWSPSLEDVTGELEAGWYISALISF